IWEVATRVLVVALVLTQELGDCLRLGIDVLANPRLQLNPRLACRCEQPHTATLDIWMVTQSREKCCLASTGRPDQNGNPGGRNLFESGDLLGAGLHFGFV